MSDQEHTQDEDTSTGDPKERDPSFDIFRRNAVMFNFYRPTWMKVKTEDGDKIRSRFFVSASTFSPQLQKMDFKGRITVTLNPTDLGKLIHGVRNGEKVDLFHKSQFKTTTISYSPDKHTFGMNEKRESQEGKRAFVNLSNEEIQVLLVLFEKAIVMQTWGE